RIDSLIAEGTRDADRPSDFTGGNGGNGEKSDISVASVSFCNNCLSLRILIRVFGAIRGQGLGNSENIEWCSSLSEVARHSARPRRQPAWSGRDTVFCPGGWGVAGRRPGTFVGASASGWKMDSIHSLA